MPNTIKLKQLDRTDLTAFVNELIDGTGVVYTANRALVTDSSGDVVVSSVTSTELGYLSGVSSAIQTQINTKQATITGAATTITSSDLTASRALVSNGSGKVAVSSVTSTELGYVSGVTSALQTQLNAKQPLDSTLTAFSALTISANSLTIGTGADAFSQITFAANTFPARASTGDLVAKTVTDYALTIFDDAAASDVRTTLGLGTIATAAAADYLLKAGGNVTGLTTFQNAGTTGGVGVQIGTSGNIFYFQFADANTPEIYSQSAGTRFRFNVKKILISPTDGITEIYSGSVSQSFRVYHAYTDASNYQRFTIDHDSTSVYLSAETAGTGEDNIDITIVPSGTGLLKFGTHSALAAETVTGYITIKDAGGTSRKLAVVS